MKALAIKNLTKIYKNGYTALQGIDLEVDEGDFFALLGPNGAGKSTTIGIICSLVNKTSGKVWVFDHDIDTQLVEAKSCIGLVPQEFNFNVFEPVVEIVVNQAGFYGIGRKEAYQRAEKYLKQLGLWEKRHNIARELSGGLKRRLMIARALVHEPKLLILDEPTAGVDIELRHSMWEFIRQVNQNGTTIILTTHYLEEAENLCKNIAIIDEGKIIENTTMKNLLRQLNSETFVLYLQSELKSLPKLDDYLLHFVDGNTLEAELSRQQSITDLLNDLAKNNIKVMRMKNKRNRLEELFINLVTKNDKWRTKRNTVTQA